MAERRRPRGLINTTVAAGLPLYTRNPNDFAGLSDILDVISV